MSNSSKVPANDNIPYFGGCPHCHRNDGCINDGPDHWFICELHRTKWSAGSNLFSSWRDETDEERLKARYRLMTFFEVEPVLPTRPG